MVDQTRYHCCASCVHFRAERRPSGVRTFCQRLGYDTKPAYRFDCWRPKERVRRRMERERERER
nr:hypothetical protein [Alicyclobacillus macrosporangiidus]